MGKKLFEMSLDELWQLFPIYLTEHNESWAAWYADEETTLKEHLPAKWVKRINHIGSTAIKGIWAKPIIDILIEVTPESDLQQIKPILEKAGYLCMSESSGRLSFNKGYTENGFAERVFHLHLRKVGDNDELYFRDYLNAHHDVAKEYEKLKLSLWKEYEHNRDGYTQCKTDFVKEYTKKAHEEFEDRYVNNELFDKYSLLQRLQELPFSKKEYWVVAGSAMVLHGFRPQTQDIDLGCSTLLADKLEQQGYAVSLCEDGTRKILYSKNIEIFENWIEGTVEIINGAPVVSIDGLIQMKKKLGREKDLADIALIEKGF